jgi:hypothetical protein
MKKTIDPYKTSTVSSYTQLCPGMEGFNEIHIPDDRDEAFLCYEILSNSFTDEEEKSFVIESLHCLIKSYPEISDLWALLVIGYRGLEMHHRAKTVLKSSCIRFPNSLTIKLLSCLYEIKAIPYAFHFTTKNLTQTFVWSCIRVKGAFKQNNTDLALDLIEEMMQKAQQYLQIGHWALGEALSKMSSEMNLEPR